MSGDGTRLELAYDVEGPRLNLGTAPEKLARNEFFQLHGVDGRYTNSLRRFPGFGRLDYTLSTDTASGRGTAIDIRASSNFYFFKAASIQKGDTDYLLRGWIVVIDKEGGAENEVQAVFLHYDTEDEAWYTYDIIVPSATDTDLVVDGANEYKWTASSGDADHYFLEKFDGSDATFSQPLSLFFENSVQRLKMLYRPMATFEAESSNYHYHQWSYGKRTGEAGHTADTIYVNSIVALSAGEIRARWAVTLLNTHEFDCADSGRNVILSVRGQGNVTLYWNDETSQLSTVATGPPAERSKEADSVTLSDLTSDGYLEPRNSLTEVRVRYRWFNPRRYLWTKLSEEYEVSVPSRNYAISMRFRRATIGALVEDGWTKLYVYRTITGGGTYYLEQVVNFTDDATAAPVQKNDTDDVMPGIDWDNPITNSELPRYYYVYVGGRLGKHDLDLVNAAPSPDETIPRWSFGMNDTALTLQRSYDAFLDEAGEPPQGGLITAYQDMLIMKAQAAADTSFTSSTVRWSTLFAPSPENFPLADHAYRPPTLGHDILAIKDAGDYCFVVRDNGVVRLHRNSNILSVNELHRKIGGTGRYASTTAGQVLFMVTPLGVMAVDGTSGRQDLLAAIERLIIDPTDYWRADLGSIHLLFDGELGALMMLNTVKEEMYILWMENGVVTSLVDCPFVLAAEGPHPVTGGVDRAWWIGPNGYLFFANFDRAEQRQTMCGAVGDEVVNGYARGYPGAETTKLILAEPKSLAPAKPPDSCVGFEIHFLSGDNRGRQRTITATGGDDVNGYWVEFTPALQDNVGTSDIVSIAPVVFDIKMGPITDPKRDEGADLYSRKRSHSMCAVFNQIAGDVHPHKNPSLQITYTVQPGRHGTPVERDVQMRENIPTSYGEVPIDGYILFPGVKQLSSDVDFELHSVEIHATIDLS